MSDEDRRAPISYEVLQLVELRRDSDEEKLERAHRRAMVLASLNGWTEGDFAWLEHSTQMEVD